jgi:catechol 2,3-dioxygenase-like lactoylglutathione lyase family enzyme
MFSHVMVGSNDIERSKRFYDAIFDAIGARPGMQDEKGANYRHNGAMLMVRPPLNGEAASHGNGSTIGFNLDSPEQVTAWHDAGVAAGGTSIENPPGMREGSFGKLCLAYLRDPDGNKLCGLHRPPQ